MFKGLAAGLGAVMIVAGALTAGATPAHAAQAGDLTATIALDDCSASLVRYPSSVSTDRALMLTNGHCLPTMPSAGEVIQNVSANRTGTLLNGSGASLGTVQADKVLYATMTGNDVALYELTDTYTSISSKYGTTALTISDTHPVDASSIFIPSSYWQQVWTCSINGFVGTLREDQWTWHDSVRYNTGCNPTHGTSGSPIVDAATGKLVGINNTGNDNGEMCTLNNPCEVAPDGTTTATQGQSYGEETYWLTTCLGANRAIDLSISGCLLTKPAGTTVVSVTNPGNQSSAVGAPAGLQLQGSSSAGGALTWSASSLPTGLSINAATGLVSGTATATGSYTVTVTATDSTGATGSASFTWTVSGVVTGGVTNGGFETGKLSGWTTSGSTAASASAAHSGSWGAMVGSTNPSNTSSIAQTFTAPTGSSKLSFSYNVTCPDTVTYDWATATLKDNTTSTTATVLAKTCTNGAGWKSASGSLTAGHNYTLTLTSKDDNYPGDPTYTYYDDVTVS